MGGQEHLTDEVAESTFRRSESGFFGGVFSITLSRFIKGPCLTAENIHLGGMPKKKKKFFTKYVVFIGDVSSNCPI